MAPFPGLLTRNWTLKLAAFGVALILWVAVRAEAPSVQDFLDVPIQIEMSDPRWALVGEPFPPSVAVQLRGPSRALIGLAVSRPEIVVPIEAVTSADTAVYLSNSWVRVDQPGVVVDNIQPALARFSFEPVEARSVPVALRIEGELPDDLAMARRPALDPPEVRVTGPLSRLSAIDSVALLPLRLGGVNESGRVEVPVDTASLGGLDAVPASVGLDIAVEDRIEQVFSGISIVLPESFAATTDLSLDPQTASIILRGARSLVEAAIPTELRLVVRVEPQNLPEAGGEAEFPITLTGLPPLVQGESQRSVVTVRRAGPERPSP